VFDDELVVCALAVFDLKTKLRRAAEEKVFWSAGKKNLLDAAVLENVERRVAARRKRLPIGGIEILQQLRKARLRQMEKTPAYQAVLDGKIASASAPLQPARRARMIGSAGLKTAGRAGSQSAAQDRSEHARQRQA